MKVINSNTKGSRLARSPFKNPIKELFLGGMILMAMQTSAQAQTQAPAQTPAAKPVATKVQEYKIPSWWFGGAVGLNINDYRGSTQQLTTNFTAPAGFHHGNGLGLYLAPLVEFHRPNTVFGAMLQVGYDNRSGKFKEIKTPCNCPADLNSALSYITVEPSLRVAPFKGNFYVYGGPRVAFALDKSFSYEQGPSPLTPGAPTTTVEGDFSNINTPIISGQIGAGYDIPVNSRTKRTQYVISPFVAFQPYFGQDPRSIDTWTLSTVRAGVAFKFGRGGKVVNSATEMIVAEKVAPVDVKFSVYAPENIPEERRVRETFPLRNYVFFDLGSKEIPNRYVLLKKGEVKDFKEEQLEVFTPKRLEGRSDRGMEVYYNILNILGDRMGKNPTATVKLSGSSMQGKKDGLAMAESVKKYLVDVFGIAPKRIKTEGRIKPRIAAEQPGRTKDLELVREGDRRVSIESSSPALLMEFQSGHALKPVTVVNVQKAPVDSYVVFNVEGAKKAFTSWSLVIKDSIGGLQNFGPFTEESISIPGKDILGKNPKGIYNVTMVGTAKDGSVVKKEATVKMVLWTPGNLEEGMRYSVIYEFDEAKVNSIYIKYLTEVVTPKIPVGGTVIIHGHTDIIGEPDYNKKLSVQRAGDVRGIIEKALAKAHRTDVKFQTSGYGESAKVAPFENKYPEDRFYNRTVIIDIIPKK